MTGAAIDPLPARPPGVISMPLCPKNMVVSTAVASRNATMKPTSREGFKPSGTLQPCSRPLACW